MIQNIKKFMGDTLHLLWQFKWWILIYLIFYAFLIVDYLNPPEANDPVLSYEYSRGAWNYINQKVYIGSAKADLIETFLFFLIGTSNMRNHPMLAKLIFSSPLIILILGTLWLITADILGMYV